MTANRKLQLFQPDERDKHGCFTVDSIVALYLDDKRLEVEAGLYEDRSLKRAEHYLGSFVASYPRRNIDDCQRNDLTKWLIQHKEWESTFTRQDAVGAVITCFRWAEGELKIPNPYRRPKYLGAPLKPRPAIKPSEYQAMRLRARRALNARGRRCRTREVFRVALWFLWKTGCRTCEMREALWSELDWERGVIVQEEHKTVKATGEVRMIPVRYVLPLLRWLFRRRRLHATHIFTNTLGKPWTCDRFAKEFRRYARYAGVRDAVSAYCLRHGLTVRLIEDGRTEREIANVLGQKGTRYVGWYGTSTRSAADHLNDVLRKGRRT